MSDASFFEGRCSSISHSCEWKNDLDDSVCIMILLISNDMIIVENVCFWKVVVCYCGGCDPLVVIMYHRLVAVCY
jgi:hypothetical protein